MLKKEKMYRIYSEDELWNKKKVDFLHGIWCTENSECRNMGMKDAFNNSEYISGCVIDESIKGCLIFTFFDKVNYPVDKDTFVEIPYDDLLEYCKEIEMVCYMKNE